MEKLLSGTTRASKCLPHLSVQKGVAGIFCLLVLRRGTCASTVFCSQFPLRLCGIKWGSDVCSTRQNCELEVCDVQMESLLSQLV